MSCSNRGVLMNGKIQINGTELNFISGIYVQFKKYITGTATRNGVFTYDISDIKNPIIIPVKINSGYLFESYVEGTQFKVTTYLAEDVIPEQDRAFKFAVYGG